MPRTKQFDPNEVLNKAVDLFWKQGFHATSMQDLVSHLGINRASLYDTYGGKNELFMAAFNHYKDSNLERLKQFFAQQQSVKNGIKTLLEEAATACITDCDRKGCFVVNTTTELVPGDEVLDETLKAHRIALVDTFYEFLKSGERTGEIPEGKDLKAVAHLIFMIYNGIRVVSKMRPQENELLPSIDTALTLLD